MSHQDWKPVVFKKSEKPIHIDKKSKSVKKLEDDANDDFSHKKISLELKLAIQQARNAKKMTQKQLASQMNLPVAMIINYENGKAIPNNRFIANLERILSTKLPRIKKK
tara:strand:- start:844 stop:1170 length:327 start_codon:yes stop_codon:yes gene_type:complete